MLRSSITVVGYGGGKPLIGQPGYRRLPKFLRNPLWQEAKNRPYLVKGQVPYCGSAVGQRPRQS